MVVFSVVAGSSNRFRVICLWVEAEWERKGNSICMEGEKKKKKKKKPWVARLDAPWYSPSGHWSKMKGARHSSDFPGWHWTAWEGTAAFLTVGRRGKGSSDEASVTWSPHSLGRSLHQTLHSQGHLWAVLSNHLQLWSPSSSFFLCFAVEGK